MAFTLDSSEGLPCPQEHLDDPRSEIIEMSAKDRTLGLVGKSNLSNNNEIFHDRRYPLLRTVKYLLGRHVGEIDISLAIYKI